MRSSRLVLLVATGILSTGASADIRTFDGDTDSSWGVAANWSNDTLPGAGDRAEIPAAFDVVIDDGDYTVDTIVVKGSLTIEFGHTLTLENDDLNTATGGPGPVLGAPKYDNHIVDGDGEVVLEFGSTLRFEVSDLHVVNGSTNGDGWIRGEIARIEIDEDVELRNALDADGGIGGAITFDGEAGTGGASDGAFDNRGRVVSSTMTFTDTTLLSDVAGALWWQKACTGKMEFQRDADLEGDFWSGDPDAFPLPEPGNWEFDGLIRTCGELKVLVCNMGGTIGASGGFEYGSFSGTCNPGSSGGTIACTNWEVTSLTVIFCP